MTKLLYLKLEKVKSFDLWNLEKRFIIRKVWWFPKKKCIYVDIINVINDIYVKIFSEYDFSTSLGY